MQLTRREFLTAAGALGLAAFLPACARQPLAAGRGRRFLLASAEGELFACDLDGAAPVRTRSALRRAHGFVPLPSGFVLVLDKEGEGGALFDPREGEVARTLAPTRGRRFYGHGAYAAGTLYTVEAGASGGVIVLRDPATLEPKGEWASGGRGPHDLALLEDQGLLAVCNGVGAPGQHSNVSFLRLADGALARSVVLAAAEEQFGHLTRVGPRAVAASTQHTHWKKDRARGEELERRMKLERDPARRNELFLSLAAFREQLPSATYRVSADGELAPFERTGEMVMGFSIAASERFAAVTHGPSRGVAFFSLATLRLARFLPLPEAGWPSAVSALPGGDFVVGSMKGDYWRVRAPELEITGRVCSAVPSEHSIVV